MKKNAAGSTAKSAANKKPKRRPKQKSKDKRFNVDQYLNSVMVGVYEYSPETVRKRKLSGPKRQLNSALAYTTPHSQRTTSCSKIRSKSSYSHHRKKSVVIGEGLHLTLNKIVTEEDIINFTQVTARGNEEERALQPLRLFSLSQATAARKIQRAWRNYLTRKVVSKCYQYLCNRLKKDKELKELQIRNQSRQDRTVKKEAKPTLKIRKETKKDSPLTVSKQLRPLFSEINMSNQIDKLASFERIDSKTIQLHSGEERNQIQWLNSIQLRPIIDFFRTSHEAASKQIERHFNHFQLPQANLHLSSVESEKQEEIANSLQGKEQFFQFEGISPAVFDEMQKTIKQKYILLQRRLEEKLKMQFINDEQHLKTFQQLEGRMLRQVRKLNYCKQQYMRSIQTLKGEMLKMQTYNTQVAKLQGRNRYRTRKSYSSQSLLMKQILQQVTNKNADLEKRPQLKVESQVLLSFDFRKNKKEQSFGLSFPTSPPSLVGRPTQKLQPTGQSPVCYELDSDTKLREELRSEGSQNILTSSPYQNLQFNEFAHKDGELSQSLSKEVQKCNSSQSLNRSVPQKSFRQSQHSRVIRQCSQQLQQQIQAALIQELVQQIYLSQKFWKMFRPFIQKPYQFKPINDYQIIYFLQTELTAFFPSQAQLYSRVNQKINPTTLQILRLIRDIEFQIDQYELVLPQQVFKKYRKHLEQLYSRKLAAQQQLPSGLQNVPPHLKQLANQRSAEKKQKTIRFIRFERDLKIMYMKSIFSSFNQAIIQQKSHYTFMNSRGAIGPGELSLAIKEYNWSCQRRKLNQFIGEARQKVIKIIKSKCSLPQFETQKDLELFQIQFNKQLIKELEQTEYKWVNYMDQIMEIWQDMSQNLIHILFQEATTEIAALY